MENIDINIITSLLGFFLLIASLYTFLQKQKNILNKHNSEYERLKYDIEQIKSLTSNDKMAEYHRLQERVDRNEKRINDLEINLRKEMKNLSEKIDNLIFNLKK